jgi:hypothetical protein
MNLRESPLGSTILLDRTQLLGYWFRVAIVCPKHKIKMLCPACMGEARSKRKAKAARINGKEGGRPRKSTKTEHI